MATLTLNIDQDAQMSAKSAYDKEYNSCIKAGMPKGKAYLLAQNVGSNAYDAALKDKEGVA